MLKIPKLCDCDSIPSSLPGLTDKVWEQQLAAKQILISGPINEDLIEKAVMQIFNFNLIDAQTEAESRSYERQPILVFLNSPGGHIDEAFSLISAMLSSETPVHTIALGKAHSAAFMILLAGQKRFAQRFSTMMFHQGAGGVVDNFAQIQDYSNYILKIQDKVENFVIERTKIKEKKLKEVFVRQHNWYMDAEEALSLGVIHGVL